MGEQGKQELSLRTALLQAEPFNQSDYEEYRMNLKLALTRAERWERTTFHVCWVALALTCILMFVGGTEVVGAFDPYSDNANPLSIGLGVVFVIANITWLLALASHYSRFGPRIRRVKQEIMATQIEQLRHEVERLRGPKGD